MESFLNHIRTECRLLTEDRPSYRANPFWQCWLAEGQGVPDQTDEIAAELTDKVEKGFDKFRTREGDRFRFVLDMYSVSKHYENNFLGPESYLKVDFVKSPNHEGNIGGAYVGTNTATFDRSTNLLDAAEVELHVVAPKNSSFTVFRPRVKSAILHELIHAYEDYNRRYLNRDELGLALYKRGYPDDLSSDCTEELKWLTYILDPAEQKTFIGQSVQEVRDTLREMGRTGRLDRAEQIRSIDSFLSVTSFWPVYEHMKSFVTQTQWDRIPKFKQEKLVSRYNELIKGTGRAPANYRQLIKKLKFRWNEFDQKLKVVVSKAVASELTKTMANDPSLSRTGYHKDDTRKSRQNLAEGLINLFN